MINQTYPASLCSGNGKYHSDGGKRPKPLESMPWLQVPYLVDNPQQVPKDQARWVLPSTLLTRDLRRQYVEGLYWLLWADFDTNPRSLDDVETVLKQLLPGCDWELYTTHSATPSTPKARVLVPLAKPLDCKTWVATQKVFHRRLEAQGIACDIAAQRPNQILHLPNKGVWYDKRSCRSVGVGYVL